MTEIALVAKPARASERNERTDEPVTFGVPMPSGAAQDGDSWFLREASGRELPVQARAVDRWPDGSVRWLLADAQISRPAAEQVPLTLIAGRSTAAIHSAAQRIVTSAAGDAVSVDTGSAVFVLRTGRHFPFESVSIDGAPALETSHSGLDVVSGDGAAGVVGITAIDVRERGPLRASVRLTGDVRVGGDEFLRLTAWVDLYAGSSCARIRLCLTNPRAAVHRGGFWDLGDPQSIFVKDASLVLALPRGDASPEIVASAERGAAFERQSAPFELYQDSSGGENWQSANHINRNRKVRNTFRGYRLKGGSAHATGLRASPIVELRRGESGIALAVPAFWENFPKAIESDGGSLRLRVFPQQYDDLHEIQPGEQKTHECFVAFGRGPVPTGSLAWARSETVVSVDPSWVMSTKAVPFLAPLTAAHAELVQAAVEGNGRFEAKREVVDEYGWRHFGEIYGDHEAVRHQGSGLLVSHYNNQYDPVAGFAHQFLRTADPRWWLMARELAAHVVDIDIYHTDRDKAAYNHGLFWHTYHYGDADTATHRTYPRSALGRTHGGGPSADHNYTTGLMHYYFMTGDEAARDTVVDLAQFVIDMEDGRKTPFRWADRGDTGRATLSAPGYYGAGRAAANSLNALIDAHRLTGDRRFIDKAERLIRRVVHPAENIADRRLDVPEQRWFYTMFLQSLGKYLNDKVERGELDEGYAYGRASLLHYARWMAEHEHPYFDKPEKLEFKTETWPAQDIRKSDAFYFAALHAADDERVRFLERARFFHEYSTRTLRQSATRALARPVVILLTSGFMHGFFERKPEASAPAPARATPFGAPEHFVPQRERAKKKAVVAAGLGAIAFVLVVMLLVLR